MMIINLNREKRVKAEKSKCLYPVTAERAFSPQWLTLSGWTLGLPLGL